MSVVQLLVIAADLPARDRTRRRRPARHRPGLAVGRLHGAGRRRARADRPDLGAGAPRTHADRDHHEHGAGVRGVLRGAAGRRGHHRRGCSLGGAMVLAAMLVVELAPRRRVEGEVQHLPCDRGVTIRVTACPHSEFAVSRAARRPSSPPWSWSWRPTRPTRTSPPSSPGSRRSAARRSSPRGWCARSSGWSATSTPSTTSTCAPCKGVADVHRISDPYKLVSRQHHPDRSTVWVGPRHPGADRAGHLHLHRRAVRGREPRADARGGRRWPAARVPRCCGAARSSPAPRRTPSRASASPGSRSWPTCAPRPGCPIVTEVVDARDVPVVAEHADMLQVGTRNMANFGLLQAVGECGKPVLLKRGMTATIEEWLMAAEYIAQRGNLDVVLCERGIRTFETATRNTLDISAVPVVQATSHLPVIVDPSPRGRPQGPRGPARPGRDRRGRGRRHRRRAPAPRAALCDGPQASTAASCASSPGRAPTARRRSAGPTRGPTCRDPDLRRRRSRGYHPLLEEVGR